MNESGDPAPTLSPTVGRRWLAQEVRRLREEAGLKQSDVAKRLRCHPAKIGHMESMRNAISGPDLEVMLSYLGVPADRLDWYLQLADLSQEKGWWDGNRAIPDWFSLYIGLEWGASEIREWDLGYVPGLLQTRAYAEAVIKDGVSGTERHFQEQTDLRLQRQQALYRSERPLAMHAIVDEAALQRSVGTHDVMREQLEYLAHDKPTQVVLQVMPLSTGEHRGQLGSFSWLGFPRSDDFGVVYVENQLGGLYLEEPDEITGFDAEFRQLHDRALSPEESGLFLTELARKNAC